MARSDVGTDPRTAPLALDLWTAQPGTVDPRLGEWLAEDGLLNVRLKFIAGGETRLRVVRQELSTLSAEQRARLGVDGENCFARDVELCIGRVAWVYAQTLVPDTTLAMLPWLAELGDTPLGEMLTALGEVTRSSFEYAELPAAHPLCAQAQRAMDPQARSTLHARRAVYALRGLPLLVQELFLPSLVAHALA